MITPFTKKCTDCSEHDCFSFAFFCDRCGREWRSASVPFSKGGFSEVAGDETLRLLWADEHRAAFERANVEAMFHFNHCEVCGRWVCDDCFYTSEEECTDICLECKTQADIVSAQGGRINHCLSTILHRGSE